MDSANVCRVLSRGIEAIRVRFHCTFYDRICDAIRIWCCTEGKTKMSSLIISLLMQKSFSFYRDSHQLSRCHLALFSLHPIYVYVFLVLLLEWLLNSKIKWMFPNQKFTSNKYQFLWNDILFLYFFWLL